MNLHCVKSLIFSQSVGNTVWQSSSLKLEMLVRLHAMLFTFSKNFARVAKKTHFQYVTILQSLRAFNFFLVVCSQYHARSCFVRRQGNPRVRVTLARVIPQHSHISNFFFMEVLWLWLRTIGTRATLAARQLDLPCKCSKKQTMIKYQQISKLRLKKQHTY